MMVKADLSIVTGTNALCDGGFLGGTGAFCPTATSSTGVLATKAVVPTGSAATTAIPTRVQNLIDDHNKTTDPRTKGSIKARIGRILGGSIPSNVANQLR